MLTVDLVESPKATRLSSTDVTEIILVHQPACLVRAASLCCRVVNTAACAGTDSDGACRSEKISFAGLNKILGFCHVKAFGLDERDYCVQHESFVNH